MIDGRTPRNLLNLTRDPDQPAWLIDMEAFFEFSFWLAEELEDLVARHRLVSPATHFCPASHQKVKH